MNWYDTMHLTALANFALCSAVGYVCACRFSVMSRDTRLVFRLNYALLFMAATASGFQPILLREWPGVADLLTNAVVLWFVGSGMKTWRFGAPAYADKPQQVAPRDYAHIVGGKR